MTQTRSFPFEYVVESHKNSINDLARYRLLHRTRQGKIEERLGYQKLRKEEILVYQDKKISTLTFVSTLTLIQNFQIINLVNLVTQASKTESKKSVRSVRHLTSPLLTTQWCKSWTKRPHNHHQREKNFHSCNVINHHLSCISFRSVSLRHRNQAWHESNRAERS